MADRISIAIEDTYLKSIGKERDVEAETVPNNVLHKQTRRQMVTHNILKLNVPDAVSDIVMETAESLASMLSVSTEFIKRDLKRMKELGIIKREGGNL